jgi:hypothetical protein
MPKERDEALSKSAAALENDYLKAIMKVLARFPGLIMELDPQDDSMRTQTRWDWEHFGIRCTSPVSCPMLNEQYCFVICLTRTEKSS